MKLSEFKFDLPTGLIASHQAENRDESRMMVIHRDSGEIEHKTFKDIVDYFKEGDVFVGNDTKVFPARLNGRKEKTGAKIEVFLLRELNSKMRLWDVMVDPARKIRVGNKLYFGNDELVAEVIDNTTSRGRTIRFLFDGSSEEFEMLVDRIGETPIPRHIRKKVEPLDKERFQTIFAKEKGAISAPSAGLHFTERLMKRMQIKGLDFGFVTLHIGLGTFRDVDVEDLTKHKVDSENFNVGSEVVNMVNRALDNNAKICAVGASSMRCLETAVSANNRLKEKSGWTDKFIFPPYEFKICNSLVTNFHLPASTLLMTACAFGGYNLIMKAYQVAKKERYKFLAYGDCMLII